MQQVLVEMARQGEGVDLSESIKDLAEVSNALNSGSMLHASVQIRAPCSCIRPEPAEGIVNMTRLWYLQFDGVQG